MTSILVIPDSQVKPNVDLDYLRCIGEYIVAKKPDIVVHLGDFADMASLSSYDKGTRSYEGRRYKNDIESSKTGMEILLSAFERDKKLHISNKKKIYKPKFIMLLGNHENRIARAIEKDPMLHGTISVDDLNYEKYGWEVIPFLDVKMIEGIAFSHYFTTGLMGRPSSSAQAQLNKKHCSCIAGHQQGRQTASAMRADGKQITSIIAGSGYSHNEDYLGPQGNKHWRGIIMLHNVIDGEFDEVYIPLSYLGKKYNTQPCYFTPTEPKPK